MFLWGRTWKLVTLVNQFTRITIRNEYNKHNPNSYSYTNDCQILSFSYLEFQVLLFCFVLFWKGGFDKIKVPIIMKTYEWNTNLIEWNRPA